ncbi:MAG: PHP domain-containing protein [Clostridia bacterium]|nr:PHP domain-containing protein [Clostridia bacterium]
MLQDFNYHNHTYRCGHADDAMTDEDYVKEYIENGFKKMAFTDHVPHEHLVDPRKGVRMDISLKDEYLKSINELKAKYDGIIEVKTGFEVEYLPELEDEIRRRKDETDILITGQHFIKDANGDLKIFGRAPFTRDDYKRYIECLYNIMSKDLADIIAHPDFSLMGQGGFSEVEEEMADDLGKLAEEYQVPLEINLNHIFYKTYFRGRVWNHDDYETQLTRLNEVIYPCRGFWKTISKYDVRVLYGYDIHFGGQLSKHEEFEKMCAMILGDDVMGSLNFVKEF